MEGLLVSNSPFLGDFLDPPLVLTDQYQSVSVSVLTEMGFLVRAVAALVLSITEGRDGPVSAVRVQAPMIATPERPRQTGASRAQGVCLIRAVRAVLIGAVTHPAGRDTGTVPAPGYIQYRDPG